MHRRRPSRRRKKQTVSSQGVYSISPPSAPARGSMRALCRSSRPGEQSPNCSRFPPRRPRSSPPPPRRSPRSPVLACRRHRGVRRYWWHLLPLGAPACHCRPARLAWVLVNPVGRSGRQHCCCCCCCCVCCRCRWCWRCPPSSLGGKRVDGGRGRGGVNV